MMGAFEPSPEQEPDARQQMRTFLETLFGNKPSEEHILIWALFGEKKISASFRSLAEIEAYVAPRRESFNLYYGVGTRDTPVANQGERFLADTITGLYALWADIDYQGDIDDPRVHKKSGLPPTFEDAMAVVYGVPDMPPSMVVTSGHGIQGLWLLDQPLHMHTLAERNQAHSFTIGWHATTLAVAAQIASSRGSAEPWTLDSTHDIARVMRLPGTLNLKQPENPVESRLLECYPERRYSIEQAQQVIERYHTRSKLYSINGGVSMDDLEDIVVGDFTISQNPELPAEKWKRLIDAYPRALAVLQHNGVTGLRDDSLSTSDMSLAFFAAWMGWDDQEIVDLISYHRLSYYRAHPEQFTREARTKLFRADYYERTIRGARESVQKYRKAQNEAEDEIDSLLAAARSYQANERVVKQSESEPASVRVVESVASTPAPATAPAARKVKPVVDSDFDWMAPDYGDSGEDDITTIAPVHQTGEMDYATPDDVDAQRLEALKMLTQHIFGESENICIVNVMRLVAATPIFRIEIVVHGERVNINLDSVDAILMPNKFASKVAGHTKMIPLTHKRDTWMKIAQNLLAWAQDMDIGEEATETGIVTHWLNSYLDGARIDDLDSMDEERIERTLSTNANPIIKDGNLYLFAAHFTKWLQAAEMERLTHITLGNYLRTYGCQSTSVKLMMNNRRTSVNVWRIPMEIASPFIERLRD